jgi:hypothetical protein
MSQLVGDWPDQIVAARRKLEVACYHLGQLRAELTAPGLPRSECPPVPIQAHFEGVLVALLGAVEKVAEATNTALDLRLPLRDLVSGTFTELGSRLPDVRSWFKQEIYSDLRRCLRAARYAPAPNTSPARWLVKSEGNGHRRLRELLEYATAGEEHGRQLERLLVGIEGILTAGQPDPEPDMTGYEV